MHSVCLHYLTLPMSESSRTSNLQYFPLEPPIPAQTPLPPLPRNLQEKIPQKVVTLQNMPFLVSPHQIPILNVKAEILLEVRIRTPLVWLRPGFRDMRLRDWNVQERGAGSVSVSVQECLGLEVWMSENLGGVERGMDS